MTDYEEVFNFLKHDWSLDSIDSDATGYGDFEANSFDLRELMREGESDS